MTLTTEQFKELIYAAYIEFIDLPRTYKTLSKELMIELLSTAIKWDWNEKTSEIFIDELPF